jgi:oligopeptide transport system permease protein
MFRFIAARLLQTIPVLFVVATLTFFMVRLVPGGRPTNTPIVR